MALFRKKRGINLGNVSIGETDTPSKVDESSPSVQKRRSEIEEDTKRKIIEYRKENPEEPKGESRDKSIGSPLRLKRSMGSFDKEYVEIAKRYIGIADEREPTVVELSKAIIKLFEDNAKLYKKMVEMREKQSGGIRVSERHSWEQNNSWN